MSTYTEERTYYPDGCDRDSYDAFAFQVGVFYRGRDKWCVATSREGHQQMTHTGKWLYMPLKMTAMRWCRFDFDVACGLAERYVNDRKVNGLTWAKWEARLAERRSA